jgi:hypothetical protein
MSTYRYLLSVHGIHPSHLRYSVLGGTLSNPNCARVYIKPNGWPRVVRQKYGHESRGTPKQEYANDDQQQFPGPTDIHISYHCY